MTPEYRYTLRRELASLPILFPKRVLFCALNPSTATATEDDPTVRRMIGFAQREGATEMRLVNIYAARATDPSDLWRMADPIGRFNDEHIAREAEAADVMIAAWGATARAQARASVVLAIMRQHGPVYRLGDTTQHGAPRHPLYLRGDMPLDVHAERYRWEPVGDPRPRH